MIFDAFMFFDELDLLEIRLNILNDHVERFILVEATTTFSGQPKKLVFDKNRERFAAFVSKIEHVIVRDMPCDPSNRWPAEYFQRNAIMRGLTRARNCNWVIVSDVDEIWNPQIVSEFPDHGPFAISVACRAGSLNSIVEAHRPACVVARLAEVRKITPQGMRDCRDKGDVPVIPRDLTRGGWHFSWIRRSEAEVNKKLAAFAHSEFDNDAGRKFWLNKMTNLACTDPTADETLPLWIRSNLDNYKLLLGPHVS